MFGPIFSAIVATAYAASIETSLDLKLISRYAGAASCLTIYSQKAWSCGPVCSKESEGTRVVEAFLNKKSQGAVQISVNEKRGLIVASFRGTENAKNAISDIQFWKSEADWNENDDNLLETQDILESKDARLPAGLKIHSGFEKLYVTLRDVVNPAVKKLADQYPDFQIVYTGYSLGGALAVLGAADFEDLYKQGDRMSIYTFGQPRTGNDKWAQYLMQRPFASRVYRYAIRGDPVVQLPPRWTGYQHVLRQYMLEGNGNISACPLDDGSGESKACIWGVFKNNIGKHMEYDFGGDINKC